MVEPFARLGDDVVVSDIDWFSPEWGTPQRWGFYDVKRGRRLFCVSKAHAGDAPSQEILLALLSAFAAGERVGRDAGIGEGRAELASDIRALIGAAAA